MHLRLGLSRVTNGFMKTYTYSRARQRLAEVLEEASREREVQIGRHDGRVYTVRPVAEAAQSPFANVTSFAPIRSPCRHRSRRDLFTVREKYHRGVAARDDRDAMTSVESLAGSSRR